MSPTMLFLFSFQADVQVSTKDADDIARVELLVGCARPVARVATSLSVGLDSDGALTIRVHADSAAAGHHQSP